MDDNQPRIDSTQRILAIIIAIIGLVEFVFHVRPWPSDVTSAVFFVALPTLAVIAFILGAQAKSAVGAIFKTITIAVLIYAIVSGITYLLILWVALIFYIRGLVVGHAFDLSNERSNLTDDLHGPPLQDKKGSGDVSG